MTYTYHYGSPLGGITLAGCREGLTGLWFDGQKHFGSTLCGEHEERLLPVFELTVRWLDIYFGGKNPPFTPQLLIKATPFRTDVLRLLSAVPYAATVTYGELADRLARQRGLASMSAQAIGGAVGHNPISVIIPCHRVLGADGSLTGYAGGIDRKLSLLMLEGVDVHQAAANNK